LSTDIQALRREVQTLQSDLEDAIRTINVASRALTDYLALTRRTGLPANTELAIRRVLQLKAATMGLYRSLMLLQAASGPLGLVTAIISVTADVYMLRDLGTNIYDDVRGT